MEREKTMFSFAPANRTTVAAVGTLPIKTEEGWGTIQFIHEVITGWEMPVIQEVPKNEKG
jgi:hypothetical protein